NSNVKSCLDMLSARWEQVERPSNLSSGETSVSPINSCLAKDSPARTSALLEQSYPGVVRQTALSNAFAKTELGAADVTQDHASALPLFVDASGNCNLPGTRGFDETFTKDFLSAVYDTNLSALESIWTAKYMSDKCSSQKPKAEERVMIDRQELSSINNRI